MPNTNVYFNGNSLADRMFEEFGYEKQEESTYCKELGNGLYQYIDFYENDKSYRKLIRKGWNYHHAYITVEEHLAIHQKMKESGWI